MASEIQFRQVQASYETTYGTKTAATRQLLVTNPKFELKQANHEPMTLTGTRVKNAAVAAQGVYTDFSFDTFLYVDHLPFLLNNLLHSVSSSVYDTSGFKHIHNDNVTASSTRKSMSLEYFDGAQGWHITGSSLKSLKISGSSDKEIKVSCSGFGRAMVAGAMTGSLAIPTQAPLQAWQRKLSIDAAGATPGTTPVLGFLNSFDVEFSNQLDYEFMGDNSNTLTVLGGTFYDCKMSMKGLFDTSLAAEFTNYKAGTPRVVQLNLETAETMTAAKKALWITACGKWGTFGHDTIKTANAANLSVLTQLDSTLTYSFQIQTNNATNSTAYT